MRILQINNHEAIGGGSERVYQLTTRLLLDQGHELATLSCGSESFDARKHSVLLPHNGYIQANPLRTLRNIREFVYRDEAATATRDLVARFKPDIAHLHIFYGQLSSSVLATLHTLGIPCVMTVHEYRMLCPVSTLYTEHQGVCERCAGGSKMPALMGRCNRGSLLASGLSVLEARARDRRHDYPSHIDHFFMVSRFCLDKHVQYLPALAAKSSVLYNFVADADRQAAPAAQALRGSYLYAGRLSREKGVALLCEAFEERPALRLRIAGAGPLETDLRQRFAAAPNIEFLGKLDAPRLKQELRAAWFSVVPSEWYENNPMSILESFAQGTPTLGAAIGGIPELVADGDTGLLFRASDKADLLRALDQASALDDGERQRLGMRAIERISLAHSEGAYLTRLLAGYQRVLASRGSAAA